ncbi:MAG: hypothetical protein HYU58_10385 [Proteobacteria bacterium]|nr:hypothetical protein [Pseudomonadota bacterium]
MSSEISQFSGRRPDFPGERLTFGAEAPLLLDSRAVLAPFTIGYQAPHVAGSRVDGPAAADKYGGS